MSKLTVLLVAKCDETFNHLKAECGLAGYDVITANHGNDALQIMCMNHVDAVICEADLPEMDGYHLCYKIRNNEKIKGTPVIIRGEEGSPEEMQMASEMGADIFITKVSTARAIAGYVYDIFNRPGA
jgi:DNA-binding response OmpR family regulator